MASCKNCGASLNYGDKRMCYQCKRAWLDKRIAAVNAAKEKFGEVTAKNQQEFNKYVKKLEKQ